MQVHLPSAERKALNLVVVGSSPTMTVVLNSPLSFGQAVSQAPQKVLHCTQEVPALQPVHESSSATEQLWSSGYDVMPHTLKVASSNLARCMHCGEVKLICWHHLGRMHQSETSGIRTLRRDRIGLAAKVLCGEGAEQALGLSVVGRAAGSKKNGLPVAREP